MQCEAIIFDLDGTLLDTLTDIAAAMNAVLTDQGFAGHAVDAYRYMVGDGMRLLVERALPADQRRPALIDACLTQMSSEYARRWGDNSRPYEGIAAMLDAIVRLGIPMAVLSNKPDDFTRAMVSAMLPGWPFAQVCGLKEDIPRKPDPQGARQIAAALQAAPEHIIFVGDTRVDMQVARRAGMYPVGVLWGFRDRDELLQNGARRLLEKPGDLLTFIG